MNNYFIILAAGSGKRFDYKKPKQYFLYKNKELFEHSVTKAIKSKLFKKIILIVDNPKKINKKYGNNVLIIKGGKQRSDSSLIALKAIKRYSPNNVLIHDAARPDFSIKLLKTLVKELKINMSVIPVTLPSDSLKYKSNNQLFNLKKENSYLTQTPQGFNYKELYNLAIREKNNISDESTLFIDNEKKLKFIKGERKNKKITFKDDITKQKSLFGIGFDIHRLVKNKKLFLGGIKIPFHSGLKGHSDGDVILHSIIDSLLGAMQKKDIGTYFPDNKKRYKNIRSPKMLKPIIEH